MKKILLSISIFLGIVLLLGVLGYLLRDPQWKDMYTNNDGTRNVVFEDFLPNKDLEYKESIDIYRLTYRNGFLYVFPTGTNMVLMLEQDKGEVVDINLPSLTTNTKVDLSINFDVEDKNILEELRCSYLSDNSCIRELRLKDWNIKIANLEE